eukprot:SAG31_NODE_816_length_11865_cov_38.805116_8_plen_57_part_00
MQPTTSEMQPAGGGRWELADTARIGSPRGSTVAVRVIVRPWLPIDTLVMLVSSGET